MTPHTQNGSIHARALLVWLTISGWSARRYDRQVTNKVNAQYAASTDAGRYNKHLLPGDAPSYKALTALLGAIRAEHYTHTLAWSDEGWRLLPSANFVQYTEWYRERQKALAQAVDAFVSDYPAMRAQAAKLLNGLYRDDDYPSAMDLRQRFTIDVQYSPVPTSDDIRVELSRDQLQAIEANITSRVDAAVAIATRDAWSRLHDVVSHMAERLADPNAIFRDTLVENAVNVVGQLRRLNVTNDPTLEAMRARVERELTAYAPNHLRHDDRLRASTARKADSILRDMAALYTPDANGAKVTA